MDCGTAAHIRICILGTDFMKTSKGPTCPRITPLGLEELLRIIYDLIKPSRVLNLARVLLANPKP